MSSFVLCSYHFDSDGESLEHLVRPHADDMEANDSHQKTLHADHLDVSLRLLFRGDRPHAVIQIDRRSCIHLPRATEGEAHKEKFSLKTRPCTPLKLRVPSFSAHALHRRQSSSSWTPAGVVKYR